MDGLVVKKGSTERKHKNVVYIVLYIGKPREYLKMSTKYIFSFQLKWMIRGRIGSWTFVLIRVAFTDIFGADCEVLEFEARKMLLALKKEKLVFYEL